MLNICADHGIVQYYLLYTLQYSGAAERMNRTLVECAYLMLEHAKLLMTFGDENVGLGWLRLDREN